MWLSLILLTLLFAIIVFQAKQGLFSTFIMAVLTLSCATLAFGTYEWVAVNWVTAIPGLKRSFVHSMASTARRMRNNCSPP